MASGRGGGRRRRRHPDEEDNNNEPGIGTILAVGAVAASVAALTFGAKKLYDYCMTDQPKAMPADGGEYRPHGGNPGPSYRAYDSAASEVSQRRPQMTQSAPRQTEEPHKPKSTSLADQLEAYYDEYVVIAPEQLDRALEVVESTKSMLLRYFSEVAAEFGFDCLINTGSAFEDLAVVSPDSFDFLVPLSLDHELWNTVECGAVGIKAPSFYLIKRQNCVTFPVGTSCYDQFLEDDCLSPQAVAKTLELKLQNFITWSDKNEPQDQKISFQGPTTLGVTYDNGKFLKIELNLSVCLQGIVVVANPPPPGSVNHSALWRESLALRESQNLRSMNPKQCCHLKCLKILKAIRLNHPSQFGIVNSYAYKMILMHMMNDTPEEDLWGHQCLQEQFVDMLNQLVYYVQGRQLPHVYKPEVNLLDGVSPAACDSLVSFILNRIGKEKLHTLLVRDYSTAEA